MKLPAIVTELLSLMTVGQMDPKLLSHVYPVALALDGDCVSAG